METPRADQGTVLAHFLTALHQPVPADALHNPFRGVPLAQRAEKFEQCRRELADRTGLLHEAHFEVWREALSAPLDVPMTWIHGDLYPRNVLVRGGELVAVIDWGDLARGDRACDLASIWLLLPDAQSRKRRCNITAPFPRTRGRARGVGRCSNR